MFGSSAVFDAGPFIQAVRGLRPLLEDLALVDVRETAETVATLAKAGAPVGTPEEGDPHPGAMRDDIGVKGEGIDTKGPYVDVGTTEPYGLYVEFGTEFIKAEPFMRPAIAEATGAAAMSSRINLAGGRRPRKSKA